MCRTIVLACQTNGPLAVGSMLSDRTYPWVEYLVKSTSFHVIIVYDQVYLGLYLALTFGHVLMLCPVGALLKL